MIKHTSIKYIDDFPSNPQEYSFIRKLRFWSLYYAFQIAEHNRVAVSLYDFHGRKRVIDMVNAIRKERKLLLDNAEAYQLYSTVIHTQKVPGDIAEVGAYDGGSAAIICEAKANKALHVFDMFDDGMPPVRDIDTYLFHKGQHAAKYADVRNYLMHTRKYKNVYLYKGLFPNTAMPVNHKSFSFVHLDVDLYESTMHALRFFYPRMIKRGVILSHDYLTVKGVRLAIDEFFKSKPEPVIEVSGAQCLIVKS